MSAFNADSLFLDLMFCWGIILSNADEVAETKKSSRQKILCYENWPRFKLKTLLRGHTSTFNLSCNNFVIYYSTVNHYNGHSLFISISNVH